MARVRRAGHAVRWAGRAVRSVGHVRGVGAGTPRAFRPRVLGTVTSCSLHGIDAFRVDVEVDVISGNLPAYHVVGLPTTSVREGAVRIRSALEHTGCGLPKKKITV